MRKILLTGKGASCSDQGDHARREFCRNFSLAKEHMNRAEGRVRDEVDDNEEMPEAKNEGENPRPGADVQGTRSGSDRSFRQKGACTTAQF